MCAKRKDIVLDYILELGFKPAKTFAALEEAVRKAADDVTADMMIDMLNERSEGVGDEEEFYWFKNSSLDLSLAITGKYDADIIRSTCNWLLDNKTLLSGTILDVGCDCGVTTCFLARLLPHQQIIAIDRCENAILCARELAERLGVQNVRFLHSDCLGLDDKFETVLSLRTAQENKAGLKEVPEHESLLAFASEYSAAVSQHANNLACLVEPGGRLISVERMSIDPALFGWLDALSKAGLFVDSDSYRQLKCSEMGNISDFQAMVFSADHVGWSSSFEEFLALSTKYIDFTLAQYGGWNAKIVFEYRAKERLYGYSMHDSNGSVSTITLWSHSGDETGLLYYIIRNNEAYLFFYDINQLDELKADVDKHAAEAAGLGWSISPMA